MAMSDSRFAKLAAEHNAAHEAEKTAKAAKGKAAAKLIPELKSRGIKAIDILGWKVTNVIQHYNVYHTDKAKRVLTKAQFMAVSERVVTADKVAQALSDGTITETDLGKFVERKPKANYIAVSASEVQD